MRRRASALIAGVLTAFLGAAGLGSPVHAGLSEAEALFDDGAFLEAANRAGDEESAEAGALKARALLAAATLLPPGGARHGALLAEAMSAAEAAIKSDPELAEPRLQKAAALGFLARSQGPLSAHFTGAAAEAKNELDRVLDAEPDNAWAHALLGGWHLEIAGEGPLARVFYDVSVQRGIAHYERALEIDPENVLILFQYALQLAGLGGHDAAVLDLTARAEGVSASSAIERLNAERALMLRGTMESGDQAQIAGLVRRLKGVPEPGLARSGPTPGPRGLAKPGVGPR